MATEVIGGAEQPRCYFLELPPELRNDLYELAFTSNDDPLKTDLFGRRRPCASFAYTCRQIWQEAGNIFNHSWKLYWSQTRFVVPHLERFTDSVPTSALHFGDRYLQDGISGRMPSASNLAMITRLDITSVQPRPVGHISFSFRQGKWKCVLDVLNAVQDTQQEYEIIFAARHLGHWRAEMPYEIPNLRWCQAGEPRGRLWKYFHTCDFDEATLKLVQRHCYEGHLTRYEVLGAIKFVAEGAAGFLSEGVW